MYPARIIGRGHDVVIESRGELLGWLRKHHYGVFRRMHISGWRKCNTWEEVVVKLGLEHGFEIQKVGEKPC